MKITELEKNLSYEEIKRNWRKYFYQAHSEWEIKRVKRLLIEELFEHYTGKIDMLEMHVPFTKYEYAFQMMDKTAEYKGKKMLIEMGDNINLDMLSYFYHADSSTETPMQELNNFIRFLRTAEKVYDYILVMITNHDNRIYKFIDKMIKGKDQARALIEFVTSYSDIFEKVKLNKTVVVNDYILQIGSAIMTHFEDNSIVPATVARNIVKYLYPRIEKEWDTVFQAHTHCQLKLPVDRKLVIETGACCGMFDYWRNGKMNGKGKAGSVGYATCEMKNGVAIPNLSNFVFCEWEAWL